MGPKIYIQLLQLCVGGQVRWHHARVYVLLQVADSRDSRKVGKEGSSSPCPRLRKGLSQGPAGDETGVCGLQLEEKGRLVPALLVNVVTAQVLCLCCWPLLFA